MVMVMLNLPEALVSQAQQAGILNDQDVAALLQAEIERRQRIDRYFNTLDQLAALQPPLTQEEIDAELKAYKAEQKKQHS